MVTPIPMVDLIPLANSLPTIDPYSISIVDSIPRHRKSIEPFPLEVVFPQTYLVSEGLRPPQTMISLGLMSIALQSIVAKG